jgi:hypothetical protein
LQPTRLTHCFSQDLTILLYHQSTDWLWSLKNYNQRFLHLENRIRNSRASGLRIPLGSSGAGQIELPIYYKRGETHEMNKSPNDRGSREAEVLCLCPICAADFYLSGKYTIRKVDEMQVVKDICTYCQVRRGMDYILIKKKTRGDANDNDR